MDVCRISLGFVLTVWSCAGAVLAEPHLTAGYSTYGTPGLIDMPSAALPPDGELALTTSYFSDQTRNTLTFQIAPRLSGSFRYALLYDVSPNADPTNIAEFRFDRSFSLQYRLVDEAGWRPAVALGLNDFLGTGFYGSEYLVATSRINPRLRVTAGIGWGRLAGVGGFDNPLAVFDDSLSTRGGRTGDFGGQLELDNLFRGDAAFFGGVEWQATEDLRLVAEYSSDAYPNEDPFNFERRSPLNFGLAYDLTDEFTLAANYLYGAEVGVRLTYAINPADPPYGPGIESAPLPVRDRGQVTQARWDDRFAGQVQSTTARAMDGQGLSLHGLTVQGGVARVEVENLDYIQSAQAVGRTARILSRTLPADVAQFDIVLVERGMAVSQSSLRRADIEALEYDLDGAWSSFTRATITDAVGPLTPVPGLYPRLDYGIAPYFSPSLFDPDAPFRADVGFDLFAGVQPAPGLVFSGTVRQRVIGNLDEADRPSTSDLPRVRSESNIYGAEADTTIPRLTGAYYVHPAPSVFGRVTAGYLEPQFGGLSAEVLFKPVESRFAVGAEVNYARQRGFEQLFAFRDYDVITGHVSGYLDMGNGYHAQLDVGRYLAGDWGATFALDRAFENGWRVGAFATLTDVPFDDFGEGSFDKGIRLSIPVGWSNGQASREVADLTIRPVLRDGGARLNVDGRLYDVVRPAQGAELADSWGRFWR